jgi:hypothetical protein
VRPRITSASQFELLLIPVDPERRWKMAENFAYADVTRDKMMELPWRVRIKLYTEDVLIMHERLLQILDDILWFAAPGSGVEILLLTGPGGAGKTGALKVLRRHLLDHYMSLLLEDANIIPFVFETMKAGGEKTFRWNVFYRQLGRDLNVPLLGMARKDVSEDGVFKFVKTPGRTYPELLMGVEDALRQRKTLLLALDEIAHVFDGTDDEELLRHLNVFKTMSNFSNVALLFAGGYENQRLMVVNGPMSRRCLMIYLEPYYMTNTGAPEAYKRMVRSMVREMPIEVPPDLEAYMDVLCVNCNGLAGTTKDLLARAAGFCERQKKWTESCLERALFSDDSVVTLQEEIEEGEKKIESSIAFLLAEKSRLDINNLMSGIEAARTRRHPNRSQAQQSEMAT